MTPVQTGIREQQGSVRTGPGRSYPPTDVLFPLPTDASLEIVVDWQLESETENSRR